jgi:diadenosine tetraphosphate (Ap4A) HIT family hydrolase/SAM-dependent methyltransferase
MTAYYSENCEFCDELNGGRKNAFRLLSRDRIKSRFILSTKNFTVFPALGAFVPGYVLIIPKKHVYNLGQIPNEDFGEFEKIVNDISAKISNCFMQDTILFEHGAISTCERGGACIDHAHLHICPTVYDVRDEIERRAHSKYFLGTFLELKKWQKISKPYLFYQGLDGQKTVYIFYEDIPSQYVRRLLTHKLNIPDEWDYLIYPHFDNILLTYNALLEQPSQGGTISEYNYRADYFIKRFNDKERYLTAMEDLERFTQFLHGKLILDAGAGSCNHATYLTNRGFWVEAIDLAERLLRITPFLSRYKRIMDVRHLAYPNNIFDGIWCSATLLHMPIGSVKQSLEEFYRVLKPQGILYFSVKKGKGSKIEYDNIYYREFYFYERTILEELIRHVGFDVVDIIERVDNEDNWIICFLTKC